MTKPQLLIVGGDEPARAAAKGALGENYGVVFAGSRSEAIDAYCAIHPAVVLLDLGESPQPSAPREGLKALSELLELDRRAKVVVLTEQRDREAGLRAVEAGAYDFCCKPLQPDELAVLLKRCFHTAQLERNYRELQQLLQQDAFEDVLGTSPEMRRVFDLVRKVAGTSVPVLILGERGTGKEMVARAIHQRGNRKNGPFVAINCSGLPEPVLESELFGLEQLASTGASVLHTGRIEAAGGGTLFLDQIDAAPLPLQARLLRFLQEQRFRHAGGASDIESDARVIAGTGIDLKKSVSAGGFLADLYDCLSVVQVTVPPLRQRNSDIRLLAQFFLQCFSSQFNKPGLNFDREAIRAMRAHPWPGNVHELESCIRRAVIKSESHRLTAQDLGLRPAALEDLGTLRNARETVERELIDRVLRKHAGKIAAAAMELGVSRPTLYGLMKKLGLKRERLDGPEWPS